MSNPNPYDISQHKSPGRPKSAGYSKNVTIRLDNRVDYAKISELTPRERAQAMLYWAECMLKYVR